MNTKRHKPKGKTPSLIGSSNGRPRRADVKRKSKCARCKCEICVGDDCFEIPKVNSGFPSSKRYCVACYQDIIVQTEKDIEEIKNL